MENDMLTEQEINFRKDCFNKSGRYKSKIWSLIQNNE